MRIASARRYLLSGLLSTTGVALTVTVLFKQAYDVTGDELTIGLLGLLQFIPAVVLFVVSGYLADRFDRRRVAAIFDTGRVVCALGLGFYSLTKASGNDTEMWPIYLLTLAFGSMDAIALPARRSLLPLVVQRAQIPNLVTLNASAFVGGTIAGPVLGGWLYTIGVEVAYLVAAGLFAVSIPLLISVRPIVEPTRLAQRPSLRFALQGLTFIRRTPVVLSVISLDMFAVLFGGAVALLPVIAEEQLAVGDVAYGLLRAAPGIGAALTGLVLAIRPISRFVGPTLLTVVGIFGLGSVALGWTTSFAVAFVALAVGAGADMVSMTIRGTLIPLATPDEQLGRVTAVSGMFLGASNELGAFESGVAARWFGVPWAVAGGGLATIGIALGFAIFVPTLRRIDTYDEVNRSPPSTTTRPMLERRRPTSREPS